MPTDTADPASDRDDLVRPPDAASYLATYGTLMSGYATQSELGVDAALELVGPCTLRGDLFDLGDYPGIAAGDGEVRGELYRVLDEDVFQTLDAFEAFEPEAPEDSLYQRKWLRLIEPEIEAWVYVLTLRPALDRLLPSGAWPTSPKPARAD